MQASSQIRYNSYQHLLKVVINIALSTFNFGYCNGYFNSISFKDISNIFSIGDQYLSTMQGILTGCMYFTGGVGAFWSSILLTRYSRKQCLQILCYFMILNCLLLMVPSLPILLIARCLQGVCIGVITVITPLFIREFSPTELASSLCPWNQIGMNVGLIFSFVFTFLLSFFFSPLTYWRIVFVFPAISSLTQLYYLRYKYPYETPKWLLLNQKQKQAKELLAVIYKEEYVDEEYEQIKKAISANQHKERSQAKSEEVEMEDLDLSKKLIPKKKEFRTNPLAIFAAIHLAVAQQMVGMGPIIAYSGEIVGQIFPSIEKLFPILINCLAVFGAFLCVPLLKKFGRKKMLQYGALLIAILLFLLSAYFFNINYSQFSQRNFFVKSLVCLWLLGIRLVFSVSMGPVVWVYMSEVVQPNILPYAAMLNWVTVALVNTLFPILKYQLNNNPAWIFIVFACYTFMGFLVNKVVLIETMNKNQYQIMKEYDEKWNKFNKN